MISLPTIAFDTSAINALENGGARSEPFMKAMECGFNVRLPAMSAEEILSVPANKAARREALLARCQRLLASGQFMWPPHEIIRLLTLAHFGNASQFDWQRVDVHARIFEQAVLRRDFTEELCSLQLVEQRAVQDAYEKVWKRLRPHLQAIRAKEPSRWPATFRDTFPIIRADGTGLLWGIGRDFYKRVTNVSLSESRIREFMDACPPFRAAIYAVCLSWYDRCVRLPGARPEFVAGRNDMLMSVYLPYCGRFVVADWNQEQCLREVASASDVACEILSYRKFKSIFTVAA